MGTNGGAAVTAERMMPWLYVILFFIAPPIACATFS